MIPILCFYFSYPSAFIENDKNTRPRRSIEYTFKKQINTANRQNTLRKREKIYFFHVQSSNNNTNDIPNTTVQNSDGQK